MRRRTCRVVGDDLTTSSENTAVVAHDLTAGPEVVDTPESMKRTRLILLLAGALTVAVAGGAAWWVQTPRPPRDLSEVTIHLDLSECDRKCPSYRIEIHGDGRVNYQGRRHVKVKGRRTKEMTTDSVRALVDAIYETSFFRWDDSAWAYNSGDCGCTTLALTVGERVTVRRACCSSNVPQSFRHLVDRVVRAVDEPKWTKGTETAMTGDLDAVTRDLKRANERPDSPKSVKRNPFR